MKKEIADDNCKCYDAEYECKCIVTNDLVYECDDCIEDKCKCYEKEGINVNAN